MVVYHLLYDLAANGLTSQDPLSDGWRLFARGVLATFLIVSGLSDALAAARIPSRVERWRKARRRTLTIGACALIVTAATYLSDPEFYVRFGVLHCLAVAALLLPLLDRWSPIAILSLALLLAAVSWPFPDWDGWWWSIPLGLAPVGFQTMDYVPLLPWFGLVALGHGLGRHLQSRPSMDPPPGLGPIRWLGRRALPIYLLHQPILLLLIHTVTTRGK